MCIFSSRWNRIDRAKSKSKSVLAFKYLEEFSRPFCLDNSRAKKVSFPLNSSNDTLIDCFSSMCELIAMAGSNFLDGCKKYHRVGW